MLSDAQIKRLWEEWIAAETRAYWYAELSTKYQQRQRIITILSLVLSSGAAVLFFTRIGLAPYIAILAAIVSAVSLVEQNYRLGVDSADHVHILSKGTVVWDGKPQELEAADQVKQTHLGV